jgi:hypothetical protein
MMTDNFIESVISPKSEEEKATMNREFCGMMAVQHSAENECGKPISASEKGGDV